MAREHKPVTEPPKPRRKSQPWDRLKILVLLGFLIGFNLASKVNAPFTTFEEGLSQMWSESFGRVLLILFPLEIIRQIHYWIAEHSAAYNEFWTKKVFGGVERQTQKRVSPWTRFRLARYVRIAIFLFLYGVIVNLLVDSVSTPWEAITQSPSLIAGSIGQILQFAFYMFFVVAQFGLLFWFLSRGGVDVVLPEEIETRYDDVWGQDHVLSLVKENVGFLEKPDEIEAKGGYIPGGILLWGPPGTGKTLIAEATAGEVGSPFVFVDPGAFINMFMGVGVLKVKGLFRKLRKLSLRHGGVVVFFDEADSLGSRGALAQGGGPGQPSTPRTHAAFCNGGAYLSQQAIDIIDADFEQPEAEDQEQGRWINRVIMGGMGGGGGGMGTLQALLTEISGLKKPRGVSNRVRKMIGMKPKPPPKYRIFIMMATNMPNVLDPALLRPGRIDRIYKVGYPAKDGRLATFKGYLDKVRHDLSDEQIDDLATKTPYYSGAKIKDLVNEALILALREDRETVHWNDIWKAKTLKEMGPAEGFEYVDREEFAVAIHEASHAVAAYLLKAHADIDIATIERRGETGGFVSYIAIEDRFVQWRSELEVDVKVALASLAGERMFFEDDNSMGVGGDLANSTRVVSRMIGVWGMGDTIASMAGMPQHILDHPPDPSEQIARTMRGQVERRLQQLYDEVYELLEEHRHHVLGVALRLQDKKTIPGSEVAEIIGMEAGAITLRNPQGFGKVDPQAHREESELVAAATEATTVTEVTDVVDPATTGDDEDPVDD